MEDDTYQQQLLQYLKHPVDLNTAGEAALSALQLLSPVQVQNCILYRSLLGKFISMYELQAIPGWDVALIQKLLPYIRLSNHEDMAAALRGRFKNGTHSILIRVSQVLERAKGYLTDSAAAVNYYPGSPQKVLVRYTCRFKNLMQYGIVAEKDAGEQFFRGKQQQGFDFYSAHFFTRHKGVVQALALGDFTVNLGQGLTQWQTLAFKKSADVLNIKRVSDVLRPYHAAGEVNFHRGAGITAGKKNLQVTLFVSYRKVDANLVTDTALSAQYISSLQTSGYHRTRSETDDKGIQQQWVTGGNISYHYKTFQAGLNTVRYTFKLPIKKQEVPYNMYGLKGTVLRNYSFDYSYTYKNLHWFGEAAIDQQYNKAVITGLMMSVSAQADAGLLYRNIAAGYQSLYTAAFTENTYPINEKGIYMGISLHPDGVWKLDAYADFYKFPWLTSSTDAPTAGEDYLLQLTYSPTKKLEVYSRFRTASGAFNSNPQLLTLSPVVEQSKKNWRTQFSYKVNRTITVKSRVEIVFFKAPASQKEQGAMIYTDFFYKAPLQPWSGSLRLQYYETGSYNSRIYAYENDVLFSNSIPVFYGKGLKYYINVNAHINKKCSIWARFARTVYKAKAFTGSGLDEISGNKKTEVKLQFWYQF